MAKQKEDSFEEENKKYFDEKNYRTIIVGKDGIKNQDDLREAMEALAEGKLSVEDRDEVLKQLKASNSKQLLLKSAESEKSMAKKARLISACWEIELDCADHFLFFVKQAIEGDYMVAMECLTVIENIESEVPSEELEKAAQLLSNKINDNSENAPMLEEILNWAEARK